MNNKNNNITTNVFCYKNNKNIDNNGDNNSNNN